MTITAKDLPILLALLEQHPEWREALRVLLLSEDLLRMPGDLEAFRIEVYRRFAELAEAVTRSLEVQTRSLELQARLEERVSRLEEAVSRLAEAQARTEEAIVRLAEAQARVEERVGRLEEAVARLMEAYARMEERLTRLEELVAQHGERLARLEELVAQHGERLTRLEELVAQQGERLARLEELVAQQGERLTRLEELVARIEERLTRVEENLRRLEARMARLEERLMRRLNAFGARWGLRSERAWREGMRAVLEAAGFDVEQWVAFDPAGEVFDQPSQIELDVVVHDGKTLVVELRTSVSREAMPTLERKVAFYERRTGRKVDRRILVTPWYEPGVDEMARRFGWEIYGEPEELTTEG